MSSGHVAEIANQPLMPSRPEEFHRESLTGRVAELKQELPRIADFRGDGASGWVCLHWAKDIPDDFFCSAGVRSWPKAVQPTGTAMSVGAKVDMPYEPVAQNLGSHGV